MEEERKPGFFERLKMGLKKSRDGFASDIDAVFLGHEKINDDLYEELEEVLIMGDVGVNTTEDIIESLKKSVKENRAKIPGELKNLLYEDIRNRLSSTEDMYDYENKKSVIMVVGVNGVGKTTTVGKIAGIYHNEHKKTLVAACDTFRAAANAQLEEWAKERMSRSFPLKKESIPQAWYLTR